MKLPKFLQVEKELDFFVLPEHKKDVLGQEVYDPHSYKIPELGYIEIMARKGREDAIKKDDSLQADKFQHILDNVKIVIDKLG